MTDSTDWITRKDAADLMGLESVRSVDYHVRMGHLTKHVDGLGRTRLSRSEVLKLIEPLPVVQSSDR
jgi:hypothetical protein